jgi:sodium-coupled monocarboxylate transporter 8/12
MPLIVVDTLGKFPGLAGLFVAGIFSGSLSTVSSAINSLAAVTLVIGQILVIFLWLFHFSTILLDLRNLPDCWVKYFCFQEDYIKPFLKVPMAEDTSSKVIQAIALGYGLLTILFSFLATFIGPGVLQVIRLITCNDCHSNHDVFQASLSVFGIIGGPLLGLFTLGMFFPFAKSLGAILGFSISIPFLFWMSFGHPRPAAAQLPLSTDQCHKHPLFLNSTMNFQQDVSLASGIQNSEDFFYLYKARVFTIHLFILSILIC